MAGRNERDAQSSRLAVGIGGLVAVLLAIWVILRLVRALFFIVKMGIVVAALVLGAIAISKALSKRER